MRCVYAQYSSSVSPLTANTGVPAAAMAAAAWSWVEKMLHEAQRTWAPSACRVSISTAVWMVMCRQPAMRAPASGLAAAYSSRVAIRPGISVSAMAISLRPQSARARSATWKSCGVWMAFTRSLLEDADDRARRWLKDKLAPAAGHGGERSWTA